MMKIRISILALIFLLLGVSNADAQKHHYKGKKGYAKHGHYHKGHHSKHYRNYDRDYRYGYRDYDRYNPRHYPSRYSTRRVYVHPAPVRYYSRPVYHRPFIQASIIIP